MNDQQVAAIVERIKYRDWDILLRRSESGGLYLQIRFLAPNNDTGLLEIQNCRKWLISEHMTTSEIVLTAWKAVQAAVEHEAREMFTYRGERIFGPHIDVEALAIIAGKLDARTQP